MRHSRWLATLLAGCLTMLLLTPSAGRADQILPIDGGWQSFSWEGAPNAWDKEGAFTFTALGPVNLRVTDTYVPGDRFQVRDGKHPLGITGPIKPGGAWANGPDAAYGSEFFSWGDF